MFAVVKTGGKQYRVEEGRSLKVDRLAGELGDAVELGEILMIGEGADITVGAPLVSGARVLGTITEQGRAPKIVVFRYKNKTRQRKKTGHRQHFTMLRISDVLAPGQEPKPKEERKPRVVAEQLETSTSPEAAIATESPADEKPKRGRRKAAEPAETPTKSADATEASTADEKPKRTRRKKTE